MICQGVKKSNFSDIYFIKNINTNRNMHSVSTRVQFASNYTGLDKL